VTGLGDGYVCRWGGEEFLIVLPTDEHCMRSYMEEFRHKVAVMGLTYEKQRIDMTISVGFGTYEEGKTLQSLLREADENLYYVKEHGRNAVRP
jgi:diguanylate cyclase (GGDEF)-like protein